MDDLNKVETVNRDLKTYFGTDDMNRPIFRIVWSDSQIEKRFGVFSEFYGPIFLSETKKMAEVPKYPYIKHRWVLEKLMYAMTDEVIGLDLDKKCYEPVYTFEDKFGTALPVEWWAAEMVVKRLLGVMTGDIKQKTPLDHELEENAAYAREVAYTDTVISDALGGTIATKIGAREAIIVP